MDVVPYTPEHAEELRSICISNAGESASVSEADRTFTLTMYCDPYLEQYERHIWTDDCGELFVGYANRPVYKWDGKRFVK